MTLTILKIGGSIITKKNSIEPEINHAELRRVCREIKEGKNGKLILIHGAGSYGHPIVNRTGIHKGISNEEQLKAFGETQALQNELNSMVCKELEKTGLPAIPIQASSSAVMDKGQLLYIDTRVIKGLLDLGMVPVLYGVPAYDIEQGCSILSGDVIITYLARELNADNVIHASDVDGVYDKDPKKHEDAVLLKELLTLDGVNVTGSNHVDVTGGMRKKISQLLNAGVTARIINGLKEGMITLALKGETSIGNIIIIN